MKANTTTASRADYHRSVMPWHQVCYVLDTELVARISVNGVGIAVRHVSFCRLFPHTSESSKYRMNEDEPIRDVPDALQRIAAFHHFREWQTSVDARDNSRSQRGRCEPWTHVGNLWTLTEKCTKDEIAAC